MASLVIHVNEKGHNMITSFFSVANTPVLHMHLWERTCWSFTDASVAYHTPYVIHYRNKGKTSSFHHMIDVHELSKHKSSLHISVHLPSRSVEFSIKEQKSYCRLLLFLYLCFVCIRWYNLNKEKVTPQNRKK